MKFQVYIAIMWRIIVLVLIGMALSFVTPSLRAFFGDVHIPDDVIFGDGVCDRRWEWGARHYWYVWGVFCLFALSLINFIVSVCNIFHKHYSNTF